MPPDEQLIVEPRYAPPVQRAQGMSQTTLYLIGVVSLSGLGVIALVALEVLRPDGYNTAVVGQILSLIGPSIIGLMVLLRSVANGQGIEEAKRTAAVATDRADDAARKAEAAPSVTAEAVKHVIRAEMRAGS